MRRFLLMILLLLLPLSALAAEWTETPDLIRPGKSARLVFDSAKGTAEITLSGEHGDYLLHTMEVKKGGGTYFWDGCVDGEALPAGQYILTVKVGKKSDTAAVTVGDEAPMILMVDAEEHVTPAWSAWVDVNMPGTLTVTLAEDGSVIAQEAVEAGMTEVFWDGTVNGKALTTGDWELYFRLTDDTGFVSGVESFNVYVTSPSVATDLSYHTPNEWSDRVCDHEVCFWKLPMGEMNEEAIWQVLTQPVTVLRGEQKAQINLRAQPDEACTVYTGEVTCDSQAVHILERGDTWTLVEAYSSSTAGSKVEVWAEYCRGWVKTELLQEKKPGTKYGLVVDKLQQRMYVFKEGKLFTTLMVSTGFPKEDEPFNETPAGEYLIVSWMGGFWSEKLYCDMGLRINGGTLIHEVPCNIIYDEKGNEVERNYKRCEPVLGDKASHGCIRVQRQSSPEGVSMRWLWNNLERGDKTKVIIWDDVGRVLGYPDDGLKLYYNPDGGANYHSVPNCLLVAERYWPLTAFEYGDLEYEPYHRLTRCPGCAPQLRMAEIDALNEDVKGAYSKLDNLADVH